MSQITCNCRPRRSRGWQTCDLRLSFFTGHDLYTIFLLDGAGKRQLRFAQRPEGFSAGGQKSIEVKYIKWTRIFIPSLILRFDVLIIIIITPHNNVNEKNRCQFIGP